MAIVVKNNLDSELTINHTDGEGAVTLESELLKQGSVGVGQAWVDVTSSRSAGVTYTNNTGKPIEIDFAVSGTSAIISYYVDSVLLNAVNNNASGVWLSANFTIPNGSTYLLSVTGNIEKWKELR